MSCCAYCTAPAPRSVRHARASRCSRVWKDSVAAAAICRGRGKGFLLTTTAVVGAHGWLHTALRFMAAQLKHLHENLDSRVSALPPPRRLPPTPLQPNTRAHSRRTLVLQDVVVQKEVRKVLGRMENHGVEVRPCLLTASTACPSLELDRRRRRRVRLSLVRWAKRACLLQLETKHSEKYNTMAAKLATKMALKHGSAEAIPPEEMKQALDKLEREANRPDPK